MSAPVVSAAGILPLSGFGQAGAGLPRQIYLAGDASLLSLPCVAVVGSRDASDLGLRRARRLARELAQAGVVVVSGLARGIDAAAHEEAMAAGGRTVAVIGKPLLEPAYPPEHADLQARIAAEHLVVSPFAAGTGGGKTQAYLGLIAHTLLLRRLRGEKRPDGGLGVAVTGMLVGRALARTGGRFFGPCDSPADVSAAQVRLPDGLTPPELIVQDELHLISGPLGSMVGLYEAALLTLCPKAKIVASTATVRRAQQQIDRLYGRQVALFPPPGVDASETFFARVEKDGGMRRYIGVAAPGRPVKTVLLRTYVALLAAAQRLYDGTDTGKSPADPYLTLVGYFNSLRELGGMRRLVEDEVRKQVMRRDERRPLDFDPAKPHPWYASRKIKAEPVELTSREKTLAIKESKARLDLPQGHKQAVDVLLASNMISVGVDIDRLGLMVIAGQPKTTSEYIQASSRVGRNAKKPGLVVTVYNVSKPRDRSHYERFGAYHQSFYRSVEATSVTPFSGPALDRGLPGVVVALARLFETSLTAPLGMMALQSRRTEVEQLLRKVAARAALGLPKQEGDRAEDSVYRRAMSLLDAWDNIIREARKSAGERVYSGLDPAGKNRKPLLHAPLDDPEGWTEDDRRFVAPLSMRDVEPSVHLWLTRQPLGGYTLKATKKPESDDA